MKLRDPEQFEDIVEPVAGKVSIRPARGARFHADLQVFRLGNIGMLSVRANSLKVVIEPPHDFYGVTVPLGLPFSIHERSKEQRFARDTAHLLHASEGFKLTATDGCQLLGSNFFIDPLQDYVRRLSQSDADAALRIDSRLSLSTPAGTGLQRALARAWARVHSGGGDLESELSLKELEDELIARFILATETEVYGRQATGRDGPAYLKKAEDFLCANLDSPVTRDRLAEAAGVSIRTLSRAFTKHHGMGPLAFLKQRRLDAAYRDLLGAEPGTVSVTDTAVRYGFAHMGKFAIEYRQAFGESPSRSLAR